MKREKRKGTIQTVLGLIEPGNLGITLPHEHLMSDGTGWFVEPADAFEKEMAYRPVSVDILWWLTYHRFTNLDDLTFMDEQEAIDEIMHFKLAGGNSVVEMSNIGLGIALRELGIDQAVTKVGDRYVLEEMQAKGSTIGGEDSGHLIFLDHHTTGDGIISALQVLAAMKKERKPLSELGKIMKVFPQSLINVDVNINPDFYKKT